MSRPDARTLLIVTGNRRLEERLQQALAGDGAWRLEFASSGARALDRVRRGGVDLVLYDASLTLEDGIRSMVELRTSFPMLPVIPVTDARRT